MKDVTQISFDPTHDTELIVRGLNRRLESYGKRMYHPDYIKDNTQIHLTQYTKLESRLYAILNKIPTPVRITGPKGNEKPTPVKLTGLKGKDAGAYIQISRSKESLDALRPYMNELRQLLDKTPTWQEALDNASAQAGRKLPRKEAIKEIERESTIEKLSDYQEFLADSENVWDTDPQLTELLKPFRGAKKGGTRQPGVPVAQSDIEALINYLYNYRQDIIDDAMKNVKPIEPIDDIYASGPVDFGKNRKGFKKK